MDLRQAPLRPSQPCHLLEVVMGYVRLCHLTQLVFAVVFSVDHLVAARLALMGKFAAQTNVVLMFAWIH